MLEVHGRELPRIKASDIDPKKWGCCYTDAHGLYKQPANDLCFVFVRVGGEGVAGLRLKDFL